jgi:excisionase family DNA binding protein
MSTKRTPDQLNIAGAARHIGMSHTAVRYARTTYLADCLVPGSDRRFSRAKLDELHSDLRQPLLTVTAAAAILGVHPDTLKRWTREGVIASVKTPGGRNRYTPAEVERVKVARGAKA